MRTIKPRKDRRIPPQGWLQNAELFQEYVDDMDPKEFAVTIRQTPELFLQHARHLITRSQVRNLIKRRMASMLVFGWDLLTEKDKNDLFERDPKQYVDARASELTIKQMCTAKRKAAIELLHQSPPQLSDEEYIDLANIWRAHTKNLVQNRPGGKFVVNIVRLNAAYPGRLYPELVNTCQTSLANQI